MEPTAPADDLLSRGLADMRRRIDELNIPVASYAAVGLGNEEYFIAVISDDDTTAIKARKTDNGHQAVIDWLRQHCREANVKIIAAAILGPGAEQLGERLWLEEDIVPYPNSTETVVQESLVHEAAAQVCMYFDENNLVRVPLTELNEVGVSYLVGLESYQKLTDPAVWQRLQEEVRRFQALNNRLVFFNATAQGGGVALMRHALLRFYRLLGVDVHWHVMQPNAEVFEITKTKFHNVLQGVAPADVELDEQDKEVYNAWSKENAEMFRDVFAKAKTIVIDDPQPSGMIPYIRDCAPATHIMYRSHIHLDNGFLALQDTPQFHTWQFIWENTKGAEVFVSHPVPEFIPRDVFEKTVTMPATTDLLDGLNKPLNETQAEYYLKLFDKILLEHDQAPLDHARPYLVQIARFDPSKGIPDVIESFAKLREKMKGSAALPQLVLVGHGSIDDPDGVPVYNMTLHFIQDQYQQLASDIKVVRLHHNDQILNALLSGSWAALQLSHREGFEVKVSEALNKGKPVVAYRVGGIPLQIDHGKTGYLVDIGDTDTVSQHLYTLLTDTDRYAVMSKAACAEVSPHHFTVYNALKWLYLSNCLLEEGKIPGRAQTVSALLGAPLG